MNWLILSLLSALSESAKDIFGKLGSVKTDEYSAAVALHLATLVFTLPVVFFTGIPDLKPGFWSGNLGFLFITPAWSLLYTKALKLSPLSTTLPMMAFNPVFTALLSFAFKGETPDSSGWIGIGLISAGVYFINLNLKAAKHKLFSPLVDLIQNRGALYMLGVAFLWSLGAHFSKLRVDGSNPILSTLSSGIIGVTTTYLIAVIVKKRVQLKVFLSHSKHLAPIGIFYYLATLLSSFALQNGSASYVFAVKRSSLVFGPIGGKFIFKEEVSKSKYLGLVFIALGILAISL